MSFELYKDGYNRPVIRFIAALDNKRGIADEHGIPWQGRIPSDVHYYRKQLATRPGIMLMGYGLYKELSKPYPGSVNYVATRDKSRKLREGFKPVYDARQFLKNAKGDAWNLGGAQLFNLTFDLADELCLTQLDGDFHCTKFFPEFKKDFVLTRQSNPITENGITFDFEIWRRR